MQKKSAARWGSHVLNPNLHHIATEQCNKIENGKTTFKIIAKWGLLQIQKS